MAKGGRKGKYEYWLTDDGLTTLRGWARHGLTDEAIAHDKLHISTSTLYDWKNKYSEISEALKKGKEVVDFEVENKLLELALAGNITAIIFWLKNRMPKDWRDHPNFDGDAQALEKLDGLLEDFKNAVKPEAD